jgi:hypothetical protein
MRKRSQIEQIDGELRLALTQKRKVNFEKLSIDEMQKMLMCYVNMTQKIIDMRVKNADPNKLFFRHI